MAVIKSGDSADQLHIDSTGAAKVVGTVTLASGATVALDAAALAALEGITAVVSGTVGITGAVEVTNDAGNPLPISGTVTANVGTGTQPVSGTVSVGNFPGTQQVTLDTASLAALETISVANFPATQPISGSVTITDGSGPVTVDGSVSVTNLPATQAVSGTVAVSNLPATQPISGTVTVANPTPAGLTNTELRAAAVPVTGTLNLGSSDLAVTATAATGVACTATLPAVAGQFHHISYLEIILYSTAARTGAAAPVVVTTTNLPGAAAFTFPTAGAIGTAHTHQVSPARPLRSAVAGAATTIVCPAVVGGLWRVNVHYSTGA